MSQMSAAVQIEPIRLRHIPAVTRMVYANMIGVDVDFTRLTGTPWRRAFSYLVVPLYLLTAGKGFLARHQSKIAGCGYYHLRQLSGFVFNVSVNAEHRRQGVATQLMHYLQQQIAGAGYPGWRCTSIADNALRPGAVPAALATGLTTSYYLRLPAIVRRGKPITARRWSRCPAAPAAGVFSPTCTASAKPATRGRQPWCAPTTAS